MRLAAIDLGSNSFRLEIARVENGQLHTEFNWKETVRLAAGVDAAGNLTEQAQRRGLEALRRIAEKTADFPRHLMRVVGTQTLRAAKNSDEFIARAEAILRHRIEILRGQEEARLVFEGCSYTLPASSARRLIVDIGGGSTECVVGVGHTMSSGESFHVGCVNTSVTFFKGGKITATQMRQAQLAAEVELDAAVRKFGRSHWDEAYGSSGTVSAISEILRATGWTDGVVTRSALKKLKEALLKAGDYHALSLPGLREDRREVLAGGTAVLLAVFNKLDIERMAPVGGALRYGVLYDMIGRNSAKDPRMLSVQNMQKRLSVDAEQAERVAQIALDIYQQLDPEADEEARKKLYWAALLHEVGLSVSRSDFHKHGEYLIRNSDIAGFSRSEQEDIAQLVLGMRGGLKKVQDALSHQGVAERIFCLRLATILAHSRQKPKLPVMQLIKGQGTFALSLPGSWLDEHPLSQYMLLAEEDAWDKVGFQFELLSR